ncbi:hypothetical protein [Enterocloster citroniae]|uniref:hypothetical protein n=1 Tax=Enterocloster citroniae TaxID=358743 RepID=UPI0022E85883|nr:hypothetical protein [Enterocloster citroniae]
MSKVNLETFAGGALQEKVDRAMDEVLQNMQDPNTPWKNKRGITIKISFQQNEDRDDTAVDVVVEKKLAHSSPIVTRMSIGTDLDTGEVYAEEYGKQVKGQMSINDWNAVQEKAGKAVVDGKTIDTSTGEILEEPTVEKNVVVDFRAIRQA